jgi:hypothetical protein
MVRICLRVSDIAAVDHAQRLCICACSNGAVNLQLSCFKFLTLQQALIAPVHQATAVALLLLLLLLLQT